MAQFNGKWKLASASGGGEFGQSIGMTEAQMAIGKPFNDPANNVTHQINIVGDTFELVISLGDKAEYTEKCTLGQEREVNYEGLKGQMLTKLEGDALVSILKKDGWTESRYERTVAGDKLTYKSTSSKGVTAVKEYVRQ